MKFYSETIEVKADFEFENRTQSNFSNFYRLIDYFVRFDRIELSTKKRTKKSKNL